MILCHNFLLYGQKIATPLVPVEFPPERYVGLEFGLGNNSQSGSFYTQCPCEFSNGQHLGFTAGIYYEQTFKKVFYFGAELYFDNLDIKSSYIEDELMTVKSEQTGESEILPIQFRNTAEADFSDISIVPYLKWEPLDYFFVTLGFSAGFPVYSHLIQNKELLQEYVRMKSGSIGYVSFSEGNGTEVTVQSSDFPKMISPQLGIRMKVGFNIKINKRFSFIPAFSFAFPFNNTSDEGNNFKIYSWRLMLGLRALVSSD